jgi:dihydrodipicolinate synthase/N-acetylneuraminate lyase
LIEAQRNGDTAEADRLADAIAPLLRSVGIKDEASRTLPDGRQVKVIDAYRNPVPLKVMMAGLGMMGATTRAPLGPMSASAVTQARQALRAVHASDPSLLSPIDDAFGIKVEDRLEDDAVWASLAAS